MTETDRAEIVARIAHYGQTTKSEGLDYIFHPEAVAEMVPLYLKPAAWLHDVLEDTGISVGQLRAAGISEPTIQIVELLTRDKTGESYDSYIDDLINSLNVGAMKVKLADLTHNQRPSCPPDLRKRYEKATQRLVTVLIHMQSFGDGQ